jgi:hypothetical protein
MTPHSVAHTSHEPDVRNADFQSAVSPMFNRRGVRRAAGCKPAIRQTTSLRYGFMVPMRDSAIVEALHEPATRTRTARGLPGRSTREDRGMPDQPKLSVQPTRCGLEGRAPEVHGPNARPLGLEAFHEPDGRAALPRSQASVDAAARQHRPTSDGFIGREHGSRNKGAFQSIRIAENLRKPRRISEHGCVRSISRSVQTISSSPLFSVAHLQAFGCRLAPHPSPLPWGEGALTAAAGGIERAGLLRARDALFPLPEGDARVRGKAIVATRAQPLKTGKHLIHALRLGRRPQPRDLTS